MALAQTRELMVPDDSWLAVTLGTGSLIYQKKSRALRLYWWLGDDPPDNPNLANIVPDQAQYDMHFTAGDVVHFRYSKIPAGSDGMLLISEADVVSLTSG